MAGWIEMLPEDERTEFTSALVSTLETCGGTGDDEPIARLLAGWKATAEVWADRDLTALLAQEHHGPAVPLSRPILQ